MAKPRKVVNLRPVLDRKGLKGISQAPEMQELQEVFEGMTETEKARMLRYLSGKKSKIAFEKIAQFLTKREDQEK